MNVNQTADSIQQARAEIVAAYGPWTAHNIHLGNGCYTMESRLVGDEYKLNRIMQIINDVSRKPLSELRILDLACLEGMYAIECARRGASVVGIEGRKASIEKARFVKTILGLDALELIQGDVRSLSKSTHGVFDIVLCLGIQYHLMVPEVFHFFKALYEVTRIAMIMDTHIVYRAEQGCTFEGKQYVGRVVGEHHPNATPEEKEKKLWASLDNQVSFWFTKPSLLNALQGAGFTSLFECMAPVEEKKPSSRITVVAYKGERQPLASAPLLDVHTFSEMSEQI